IDDESVFTIQTDAYVDVQILHGTAPSSISDNDFFAGVNSMAVIRGDGQAEWVQFRDVTDLGDDTIRCSYLLRGRRGSEPFATGHAIADQVVFVNANSLSSGLLKDSIDLGSVGAQRFFDAIYP